MRRGVDFVLEGLRKGENIIVHCGRGISRSATVVIAALMVKDGLSYRDARVSRVIFYMLCYMCFECNATTDFLWWLRNELASIPTSASNSSYVSSRSSIKTSTRYIYSIYIILYRNIGRRRPIKRRLPRRSGARRVHPKNSRKRGRTHG